MTYKISIVQIVTKNTSEHFIQLADEHGNICTEKEYENFLIGMGAECVKRY